MTEDKTGKWKEILLKAFYVQVIFVVSHFMYAWFPNTITREKENLNVTPSTVPNSFSIDIPGWNRLLPYDAIRPVYDPSFISPEEANLQGSELIMGVAWDGMARAYPVTVLRAREMVNDDLAGIPYLVSW